MRRPLATICLTRFVRSMESWIHCSGTGKLSPIRSRDRTLTVKFSWKRPTSCARNRIASPSEPEEPAHRRTEQPIPRRIAIEGLGFRVSSFLRTGDERDNLDFPLPTIIAPSLGIREEYTTFHRTTEDDKSLTGFLLVDLPKAVTIMDTTGHKLVIAREQIQSLRASPV